MVESASQIVSDHGRRVTGSRRAIFALLAFEHGPFTAEEVHTRILQTFGVCRKCQQKMPGRKM